MAKQIKIKKVETNLTAIATAITKVEGGAVNLSVRQVQEVMKHYNRILKALPLEQVSRLLSRAR